MYKELEETGIHFSEFDYNQHDFVGEGVHHMPGT